MALLSQTTNIVSNLPFFDLHQYMLQGPENILIKPNKRSSLKSLTLNLLVSTIYKREVCRVQVPVTDKCFVMMVSNLLFKSHLGQFVKRSQTSNELCKRPGTWSPKHLHWDFALDSTCYSVCIYHRAHSLQPSRPFSNVTSMGHKCHKLKLHHHHPSGGCQMLF